MSISDFDIRNLDTLNKVIKTVNLNSKSAPPKDWTGAYTPMVERGEIVLCDFVGIGTEINQPHFAIVLHAPKANEAITVIPLTSTDIDEDEYQFGIGKIPGFITQGGSTMTKDTYVYLNKVKEVSRKRIEAWYKRDSRGNLIKDVSNKKIRVSITADQMARVEEAISITYLNSPSLLHILIEKINRGVQFPINYGNEDILKYGFRVVETYTIDDSIPGNYKLNFKMSDGTVGMIELKSLRINPSIQTLCNNRLVKYNPQFVEFRNNVIMGLFSNKSDKSQCAKDIIAELIKINTPAPPSPTVVEPDITPIENGNVEENNKENS